MGATTSSAVYTRVLIAIHTAVKAVPQASASTIATLKLGREWYVMATHPSVILIRGRGPLISHSLFRINCAPAPRARRDSRDRSGGRSPDWIKSKIRGRRR
jgi:hypothetical protein